MAHWRNSIQGLLRGISVQFEEEDIEMPKLFITDMESESDLKVFASDCRVS